jgi:hypothetical protein
VLLVWDVTDAQGKTTEWIGEASSPTSLIGEHNMSRTSFKAGDRIRITVVKARAGTPRGLIYKIFDDKGALKFEDPTRLPRPGQEQSPD